MSELAEERILIVEFGFGGHQEEWIGLILRNEEELTKRNKIFFLLVGEALYNTLMSNYSTFGSIRVLKFDNMGNSGNSVIYRILSENHRLNSIKNLVNTLRISTLIFYSLDDLLIGLVWIRRLKIEKIKGILFQPPLRTDYLSNYRRIKLRFKLFLLWLVKNKVDRIFILNDIVGANKLNIFFGRKLKFIMLPDPVCEINGNVLLSEKLSGDEFLDILIFGSINKRKGVLTLLDALACINEKKLLRPIRLTIAGKQSVELVPYIKSRVSNINSSESNVIIQVRNEYLSKNEITNLISKSSLLWLGYEDFVWSSGVLGFAVVHSVPVVTFPGGLIAELVSTGNFGYVIDVNIEALSCFFKNLANREVQAIRIDKFKRSEYLDMNSEVNFLAKLVND